WQALLPKLCDCAMPMLPAVRRNPRLQQRLEFLSAVFPGPVEGLRLRNPHGCPACRVPGLSEHSGDQGRSVAAEMIEPRSHPQWLEWVRERGRGGFPVPVRSAMASAMDAAYRGWFDPADIEQHFHPFSVEARLRAGANLASGAVAAGGVAAGQA